jgi:hypothetical protein
VTPEQLHAASAWRNYPLDVDWAQRFLDMGRKGEAGFDTIEADGAFMVIATAPSHFNPDVKICMELAWGGRPGDGQMMLDAARVRAKHRGASVLLMGAELDIRGKAMGRLYERWGGTPHGLTYRWSL